MSRKMLGVHACWLDPYCRKYGVPAFTYFNFWWFTIRINPLRDRHLDALTGGKARIYWKDIVQFWWNRDPKEKRP